MYMQTQMCAYACMCAYTICTHTYHANAHRHAGIYTTYAFLHTHPPKNGEIALLLATNRGCVAKCASQNRNKPNDKSQ